MDVFGKLSRDVQIVLGGAVLYVIFSFLDWQHASFSNGFITVSGGRDEWTGIGVLAGLLAFAVLAWELVRIFVPNIALGSLSPGLVSLVLAGLLALFTVIMFLTHTDHVYWPAFVGLILSLVIAWFAWMRAKGEGVEMPQMATAGSSAGSAGSAEPPASAGPAEPTDGPSE